MSISVENLHEYVKAMAKKTLTDADLQVVKRGVIEESYPGGYNVKLVNGETTTTTKATSINPQKAFKKDDYVYLIRASMNSGDTFKDEYYIFGLVSETIDDFANLSEWDRFVVLEDVQPFKFTDNDSKTQIKISNDDLILKLSEDEKTFLIDGLNEQRVFRIWATFNCPEDWAIESGDYGLEIELAMEGNKKEIFYLSTQYFSGQPYKLKDSLQKTLIILKDLSTEITDIQVKLFSNNINYNSEEFYVKDVTIELGKLLDISDKLSVRVAPRENSRNYFFYRKENDKITLEAAAYYEDQLLFGDSLKYYWEVYVEEEQEIKETDEKIKVWVWKELNSFTEEPLLGSEEKIKVWHAKDNFIELSNDNEYFSTFETKIRCRVQYQLAEKTSPEITILNYNKHGYKATLIADPADGIILKKSDKVELTCEIKEFNKKFLDSKVDLIYSWKAGDEDLPYNNKKLIIRSGNDENGGFKDFTLTNDKEVDFSKTYYTLEYKEVDDPNVEDIHAYYEYDENNKVYNKTEDSDITEGKTYYTLEYVKVSSPKDEDIETYYDEPAYYLPAGGASMTFTSTVSADISEEEVEDDFNIPFEGNNFIEIRSFAEQTVTEEVSYKYCISNSILGYKADGNEGWKLFLYTESYEKTKDTEIDKNKVYYKPISGGYEAVNNPTSTEELYEKVFKEGEALGWLKTIKGNSINNKEDLFEDDIFDIDGFSFVENTAYYVYYTEARVWKQGTDIIRDESWSEPRILRKVEKKSDGTLYEFSREAVSELNMFNILSKNGTSQGAFTAENGDYYINATYIKTGTLLVEDKNNNVIFSASIHNPEVKIGGFEVDNNSIKTVGFEEGERGFKISSEEDGDIFISTKNFKVKQNGTVLAGYKEISKNANAPIEWKGRRYENFRVEPDGALNIGKYSISSYWAFECVYDEKWGGYKISGRGSWPGSKDGVLRLPKEHRDGKPIVGVKPQVFEGLEGITKVIVPEGYKVLDLACFDNMKDLEIIKLPTTLIQLGDIFKTSSAKITSFTVPGSVESISTKIFSDMDNSFLKNVYFFSSKAKFIGDSTEWSLIPSQITFYIADGNSSEAATAIPDEQKQFLSNEVEEIPSTSENYYVDRAFNTFEDYKFKVTNEGQLITTKAYLQGTVHIIDGSVGGVPVSPGHGLLKTDTYGNVRFKIDPNEDESYFRRLKTKNIEIKEGVITTKIFDLQSINSYRGSIEPMIRFQDINTNSIKAQFATFIPSLKIIDRGSNGIMGLFFNEGLAEISITSNIALKYSHEIIIKTFYTFNGLEGQEAHKESPVYTLTLSPGTTGGSIRIPFRLSKFASYELVRVEISPTSAIETWNEDISDRGVVINGDIYKKNNISNGGIFERLARIEERLGITNTIQIDEEEN